jgi:hypothetical protein
MVSRGLTSTRALREDGSDTSDTFFRGIRTNRIARYPRNPPEEPSTGEGVDYSSAMVLRSLDLSSCDVPWSGSVDVPGN